MTELCKHSEWITICVFCGTVIDDSNLETPNGKTVATSELNETIYVAVQS